MTRTLSGSGLLLGAAVLFLTPLAWAQSGPAADRYDRAAETSLIGTIVHVVSAADADGIVGVHLDLKTEQGLVKVSLGPAMFIGMNNFSFLADDRVTITGAYVMHSGGTVFWTRVIVKEGHTLTLRNEDGSPRWPNATADDPDGCGVSHARVW
jgi:hypothetical protein